MRPVAPNQANPIKYDRVSLINLIICDNIDKKGFEVKEDKPWIWQHKSYPHFEYDLKKLDTLMQEVSRKQGELIALSRVISSKNLQESQLNALENEIIFSSKIEGEILDRDSVKSSIKERLEITQNYQKKSKESRYVEILLDAHRNYKEDLTIEKIFKWHYKMFENHNSKLWNIEIGNFRKKGTMQIVSGVIGKERVYYEAPPSSSLTEEMSAYIRWFNSTPTSLLKVAIAHLWFVIIHPFDDGNGRLTRVITDRVLSEIENTTISRLYSMSQNINSDRKGYYNALKQTTGYITKDSPVDITFWCEWFFGTLCKSLNEAITSVEYVVYKAKFWDKHRDSEINERQTKVLNTILDKGKNELTTKIYRKIAKTSTATASRDIKALLLLNCIKQTEGTSGRNVRYEVLCF